MKTSCSLILSLLLLALSGGSLCHAAEKDWDRILDKYEALCESCLELKVKAESGEKVSKASLGRLYSSLLDLRSQLRSGTGSMSEVQRRRFERLKTTYSLLFGIEETIEDTHEDTREESREDAVEGTKPQAPPAPVKSLPSVRPSRTACYLPPSEDAKDSSSSVRASFPELPQVAGLSSGPVVQMHSLEGLAEPGYSLKDPVRELPSGSRHLSGSVVAAVSPWPDLSFGGSVSIFVKDFPWGVYARFRSNFAGGSWSYLCNSDGSCEGGNFWPSGGRSISVMHSCLGVRKNLGRRFSILAGAGYGRKVVLWEDVDRNWAKVNDLSASGLALECGPAATWGPVELQILFSTIDVRTASIEFAFGFRF